MAWCHQATSHYLNQCWPWSMLPYGVTRPQWVKGLTYPIAQTPRASITACQGFLSSLFKFCINRWEKCKIFEVGQVKNYWYVEPWTSMPCLSTLNATLRTCHMFGMRTHLFHLIAALFCPIAPHTFRLRQNARHIGDDIFKCIFLNENVWVLIKISLKFVPKGPIENIPTLVKITAWPRPGDKPLSEPMVVKFTGAYMCYSASMS